MLLDEGYIDPRLSADIKMFCDDDGYPILRNTELTFAKCMKPDCRLHAMYRADSLLKYLGHHKGVGPKGCLNLMKVYGLQDQFEVMEKVYSISKTLGENKPRLHLWEVAMFTYIPGFSKDLEEILAGCLNFTEYFNSEYPLKVLSLYRHKLLKAEKYFDIKMPLSRDSITVMITGSIRGYKKRDYFVDHMNELAGSIVRVVLRGPKQSADYLITDDKYGILMSVQNGSMNGKTEAAIKGGVKIVTPVEFMTQFAELISQRKVVK